MTAPSFRKINYAFRPAKHAQRKMICEALHRLARLAPTSNYRYVGFGSVGFHDFSLFHQRLGISDMLSIEGNEEEKRRFSFNRPYACIKMLWGWSYDVLPSIQWTKRAIVWLDYEHDLDHKKLADIALMSAELPSGSLLLVTIPAAPYEAETGGGPKKRLEDLIQRVGEQRIPLGTKGMDLSGWGTARVSRDIIDAEIRSTLADRNAAAQAKDKVSYRQLFNFHYADGKKMLTVGGLLANPTDASLTAKSFGGLRFVRGAKTPYLIETPLLTIRELRLLDSTLPAASGRSQPEWIPTKERQRYMKLYRYFPSYGVVES